MVKKITYLLIIVLSMAFNSRCVFGQDKDPNAMEILGCYKDSLSYLQSVSMRVNIICDVDANNPHKWHCPYERLFTFRRNGDLTEWLGEQRIFDANGNIDFKNSTVIKRIINKEFAVDVYSPLQGPVRRAVVLKDKAEQKQLLDAPEFGCALFGKMWGSNHKSIAELLEMSSDLHLRTKREAINDSSCYVLEGSTQYGRVTAWIAPEKGCCALKWTIYKGPGHFYNDDDNEEQLQIGRMESWSGVFDNVRLGQVNNKWITVGGCLTFNIKYISEGHKHDDWSWHTYSVTDVDLHPDFEALGAFKINLPNGTRIHTVIGKPDSVRYKWQDGKVVPDVNSSAFEEIDKTINSLKKQ